MSLPGSGTLAIIDADKMAEDSPRWTMDSLPIGDYALPSDCRVAALVKATAPTG